MKQSRLYLGIIILAISLFSQFGVASSGPEIGNWQSVESLPFGRYAHTVNYYSNHLYVTGGLPYTNQVHYSEVFADGTLGSWQESTALLQTRAGHKSIIHGNRIYVISGGINTSSNTGNIDYAEINVDGSVGTWSTISTISPSRSHFGCEKSESHLYILGGYTAVGTSTADVRFATLNEDGSIGEWTSTTSLPSGRSYGGSAIHQNFVYFIGGSTSSPYVDEVVYAELNSDGTLGEWVSTTSLPTGRSPNNQACFARNGYLYVLGGQSADGNLDEVLYAKIFADGSVGSWVATTNLPEVRNQIAVTTKDDKLYVVGGQHTSPFTSVITATFEPNELVAHYPFNGNANDESGTGNDGNVNGCEFGPDRYNNGNSAASFDGMDDYVEIPFDESLRPTEGLTVATWVKLNETQISKDIISCTETPGGGWAFEILNQQIAFTVYLQGGPLSSYIDISTLDVTGWFQITGTYDGESISTYLNGAFVGSVSANGLITYYDQNSIIVGAEAGPGSTPVGNHLNGYIDDIYIFNYALDPTEIEELVNPSIEGLVAYYPFTGNTLDASGNGFDITSFAATPTTDQFGNENSAYEFNGVDDFMLVADASALLDEGSDFTIAGYINPYQYSNDNNTNHVWFGCETQNYGVSLYYHYSWEDIVVNAAANGSHNTTMQLSNTLTPTNEWHHFSVRWENGGEYSFFIDGIYVEGTPAGMWNYYPGYTQQFYIGADQGVAEGTHHHSFRGKIDEFRIYNVALSDEEIADLVREEEIQLVVGSVFAEPNSPVLVPIEVTFPATETYRSAEINLSGYFEGLTFTGIETAGSMLADQGWSIQHNENESMLLIAFAGATDVSGSGVFCYLMFDVNGEVCSAIPINVEYAKFNSNESVNSTNGGVNVISSPDYGDVDQNGTIEALDASDILIYLLDATYLDCQGLANADVYDDGIVDAMDASIILMYLVEYFDMLPVTTNSTLLASGTLNTEDQEAVPNSVVSIPFNISEGENIHAFEGSISYDPNAVTPAQTPIEWSSLLEGFMISTEVEEGEIHFVGAGANPDGAEGVFMTVNFVLNEDIEIGSETTITLSEMKFNSNLIIEDVSALVASVVSIGRIEIPESFALQQNYPNPFNPSTTVRYGLPQEANVSLVIYDVRGQVIQTLESEHQPAGWYDVVWNGETADGKTISTGIYFARFVAGDHSQVIKMLYLR